jgi:hypothetical protein
MRFLHLKWSPHLLVISAIGLCLNCLPLRATETLNQIVVNADDVDLAKVQSGGKVVFVTSGLRPASFHAIDDDLRTVFQFSRSDPRPTLIIKFTDNKQIHRVSVVVGSESGKVDVYLLAEIPRDPSDLDRMKPVASIIDLGIAREASADFAPQNAGYVALRWAPSGNRLLPLAVAEVSVFTQGDSSQIANALGANALAASNPPINLVSGPPVLTPVSP